MDWAQVLVIILSIFLALFLLLGIILVILLIRLTQQIRSVTSTAQKTANNIESAVAGITRFTSPALVARMLMRQAKKFNKRKE